MSKKFTRRDTFKLAGTLAGGAATIGLTPGAAAAQQIPDQTPPAAGMFDPLTGLPNEDLFYDRTASLVRLDGMSLTVALLDIDDFEAHTARLGPAITPAMVLTMARRIQRFQNMGPLHTIGRLRAGQFGLLLTAGGRIDNHFQLEHIRRAIRAPMFLDRSDNVFTSSIGVMRKEDQVHDAAALIDMARQAASDARKAGTDNLRFYGVPINPGAVS